MGPDNPDQGMGRLEEQYIYIYIYISIRTTLSRVKKKKKGKNSLMESLSFKENSLPRCSMEIRFFTR